MSKMSDNWIVQLVGIEEGLIPIKVASTESDFLKTTVAQLKRKIHEIRAELDPEYMRLLFAGKQMEDITEGQAKENTLEYYNIQRGSTICVVMRVHGGSKERVPPPPDIEKVHDLSDLSLKFSAIVPDAIFGFSDPEDQPRVQMTCSHYVDPNTLTQYCRSLLTQHSFQFLCPAIVDGKTKKCGKIWEYSEVRQKALLNDRECQYYETKMSEYAAATYCEMKECPGCRSFIEREDLTNLRVYCVICKKKGKNDFCWQCLEEWSGPTTSSTKCGRPNCSHPDLPSLVCDKANEKFSLNEKTVPLRRACPTCGKVIEHNTKGCKFIICPRCKKEFCFICLELKDICLKSKPGSWHKDCAKPVAPQQTSIPVWSRN